MFNKIIRTLRKNKRLSLGKINKYLKNISNKDINKKTFREIFKPISSRNDKVIGKIIRLEKQKRKTAFTELFKFTFEEMYDYYLQDCKCVISRNYIYNLTWKISNFKRCYKNKEPKEKNI